MFVIKENITKRPVLIPTTWYKRAAESSTENFVPYTKTHG